MKNRIHLYLYDNITGRMDEALLQKLAQEYVAVHSIKLNDFSIAREQKGKPFFPNSQGLYFSVSHSREICAYAFAEENIGLDIEFCRKLDFYSLSKRFFCIEETTFLESGGYKEFFYFWTCKESYAKYLGCGISSPRAKFSMVAGDRLAGDIGELCFYKPTKIPGYSLCICAKKGARIYVFDRCKSDKIPAKIE